MCLGWYAAASRNGLEGRLGTDVTRIRVEHGRVQGVETSNGFLAADRVVLATGAWGNELLRPLGAEQPIALRRLQVAVLRQPIGAPLPTAVCSDAVTNVVVRPDRGQQFYAVAYFGDEPLEQAGDCDNGISEGYEEVVRRAVSERYPRLGGFELVRGFAGPYDSSPDWNPILGECPGIEGLYLALAWCGHGFKLSPAVGEVVAAEVTGRTPPVDVTDLRPTRFAEGTLLRMAYGPGARA
jgi:glycine/D-amino acid oxidase-like deaminating enzyme